MIRTVTEQHHLNAIALGEFASMKVGGMNVILWAFHADGLGHVSAMSGKGFLGLTQLDALTITPTERDMPLMSYQRIGSAGKDTLILELYDTLLEPAELKEVTDVKNRFAALPDHDRESHWYDHLKLSPSLYKKGTKQHAEDFDRCALDFLRAYLTDAGNAPYCDPAAKKEKVSVYVEGLLSQGGPAVDLFRKSLGEEKTAILLRNVLFGTGR